MEQNQMADSQFQEAFDDVQDGSNSATGRKPKRLDRSCLLCHRRKIRCDKKSPCSPCARQGVLCCYPGPELTPRRPQKTTISDVAERLAQLERTVRAISSTDLKGPDRHDHSTSSATAPPENLSMRDGRSTPNGVLVQSGDSSCYFNEVLLSKLLEEERELQSVWANSANEDVLESASAPNVGTLLYASSPPVSNSPTVHPSKFQAIQLWEAYVRNVDPLIKILHIPTAQVTIFTTINNPMEASHDVNALLFATFFAATTSLTAETAMNLLGQSKSAALKAFKQGLELSLARANFIERPNLRVLQALAIYLLSVRAHNANRSIWIFNGLAIRLAQSIGLHRDGTKFKLSPFEAEMRRRLWWHLWVMDVRASEDHGIMVANFDPSSDIAFPLNVDDNELDPSMTTLPTVRPKWSEMSFSLMVMQTCHMFQRLHFTSMPPSSSQQTWEACHKEIIAPVKTRIDQYLENCNPNIPIQRATALHAGVMMRKLHFLTHQQWLARAPSSDNDDAGRARDAHAREETLTTCCEILEMSLQIQSDDLICGFRWSFETYPQYHVLLYVLRDLCVRPVGPNIERAWAAVDGTFDHENLKGRDVIAGPRSKWNVLKSLKEKALRVRTKANGVVESRGKSLGQEPGAGGNDPATDKADGLLAEGGMLPDDGMVWNFSPEPLPDWSTLIDDFQLQEQSFWPNDYQFGDDNSFSTRDVGNQGESWTGNGT